MNSCFRAARRRGLGGHRRRMLVTTGIPPPPGTITLGSGNAVQSTAATHVIRSVAAARRPYRRIPANGERMVVRGRAISRGGKRLVPRLRPAERRLVRDRSRLTPSSGSAATSSTLPYWSRSWPNRGVRAGMIATIPAAPAPSAETARDHPALRDDHAGGIVALSVPALDAPVT